MKEVCFCLYGNDLKYYAGAKRNLEINRELLPDWETVIYFSPNNIINDYVEELEIMGCKLVNVLNLEISKKINYPMFWRYLSFFSDSIKIIRDLDSRITTREVQYINQWISSDSNYFIIRDHPWHSPVPGGLFGVKNSISISNFFEDFISNNPQGWGTDQEMLYSYMNNIDRNDISYFGFDKYETYIRRDDENFFIGMQIDENEQPLNPSAVLALKYLKELGY